MTEGERKIAAGLDKFFKDGDDKNFFNDDYDRHYSHFHCWEQALPACGQPLSSHKQCCLCDLEYHEKI